MRRPTAPDPRGRGLGQAQGSHRSAGLGAVGRAQASLRAFPHRSLVPRPGRGPDGLGESVCLSAAAPGMNEPGDASWGGGGAHGGSRPGRPCAVGSSPRRPGRLLARSLPGFPDIAGLLRGNPGPGLSALRPSGLCGAGPRPPSRSRGSLVKLGTWKSDPPKWSLYTSLGERPRLAVCRQDLGSL